ncbi:MAG: DUF11 domain-containing protein [Dokdonella sp.]
MVTAADVTAGNVTNTGTGDSDETPPDGDTLITPVVGSPAINTTKALTSNADGDASGTVTQGDVLTYTVTVTNTGNIPLTNVVALTRRFADGRYDAVRECPGWAEPTLTGTCHRRRCNGWHVSHQYRHGRLHVRSRLLATAGCYPGGGFARTQHHEGPHVECRRRCLRYGTQAMS